MELKANNRYVGFVMLHGRLQLQEVYVHQVSKTAICFSMVDTFFNQGVNNNQEWVLLKHVSTDIADKETDKPLKLLLIEDLSATIREKTQTQIPVEAPKKNWFKGFFTPWNWDTFFFYVVTFFLGLFLGSL